MKKLTPKKIILFYLIILVGSIFLRGLFRNFDSIVGYGFWFVLIAVAIGVVLSLTIPRLFKDKDIKDINTRGNITLYDMFLINKRKSIEFYISTTILLLSASTFELDEPSIIKFIIPLISPPLMLISTLYRDRKKLLEANSQN